VIFTTHTKIYAVYGVKVVENELSTKIRPVLQGRSGRRHVLLAYIFELFFVFKGTHIIHSA